MESCLSTLAGMSARTIDSDEPDCNSKRRGHNLGLTPFCVEVILKRIEHTMYSAEEVDAEDSSSAWRCGMSGLISFRESIRVPVEARVSVLLQKNEKTC